MWQPPSGRNKNLRETKLIKGGCFLSRNGTNRDKGDFYFFIFFPTGVEAMKRRRGIETPVGAMAFASPRELILLK
jgi:hypothetical protein